MNLTFMSFCFSVFSASSSAFQNCNTRYSVPDITCYDPTGTTKYIIDTRIAWKLHNDNGSAVGPYTPCKLARDGERNKWAR